MRHYLLFFVAALPTLTCQSSAWAKGTAAVAPILTGTQFEYTVQPGDFLIKIGARFGLSAAVLARENGLSYTETLRPGQRVRVHNPHLVPERIRNGLIINLPQRMLFFFREGKLASHYPIGLGKPGWPTPEGNFTIASLQLNKAWIVPRSIQEEMQLEGKIVRAVVPPGPDNPLGKHWIGLSLPGYGIHSTIAPASVYHFQSHGCIRMHPDDIAKLFEQVKIGMPGKMIYVPVLLAQLEDGRILLEVHKDIYNKGMDPLKMVHELAQAHGLEQAIDWKRVKEVIARQEGLAREVGLNPSQPETNPILLSKG